MKSRASLRRGFTLVEVMIGSALAAAIMAAALSTFVFLGRNLTRLANYQSLESKGREAIAYLGRDLALAEAVRGDMPLSSTSLTLVLPAGEVTYTFDAVTSRLRRQANFGANQDFYLLGTSRCTCSSFSFDYFTSTGAAPTSQISASVIVPYSVKQIQVRFSVQTPGAVASDTGAKYDFVSSRHLVRNKQLPDGT